jgi:lipoate synthase
VHPDEFAKYKEIALSKGFSYGRKRPAGAFQLSCGEAYLKTGIK